jgi:hypothetical protein
MRRSVMLVWALILVLPLALADAPRAAPDGEIVLSGRYSATLAGIPVGRAEFQAVMKDGRYVLSGSGRAAGLSRLFYDGRALAEAKGAFSGHRPVPARYRVELEASEGWRASMAFAGNQVHSASVEPPTRPRPDRVPVTDEHKRNVVDPLSALMALSARGTGPEACDQTLSIFDGANRYDIVLAYKRADRFRSGWRADPQPVHVCSVRYRPIAGHRPRSSTVRMLAATGDMEVWLAPVAEGLSVPVSARVPTKLGTLVLTATRIDRR